MGTGKAKGTGNGKKRYPCAGAALAPRAALGTPGVLGALEVVPALGALTAAVIIDIMNSLRRVADQRRR